jgi:hypothetical protein
VPGGLVWPETLSQRSGTHGQIRAGERVEMRKLLNTRFLSDLCLKPGIWGRRELPIAPNVLGDPLVNVEIVAPQVKTAANSIGTAAEAVAGLDLEGPMGKVASALPGSTSAGAANGLKTEWKSDKDKWVKNARDHKTTTVADADAIVAADTITAQQARYREAMIGRD